MIKKFFVLMFSFIFVLSGCTNNKSSVKRQNTESLSEISTNLTMWKYPRFDGEEEFFDEEIMEEFNKIYPNITISTTIIPWDGGPEKVNMAIAAKTTPDILHDSAMRQTSYAEKKLLVPLTDVVENNADGLSDKWKKSVEINGNYYLAPTNTAGGTAMMINVELAKELGVYDMLPDDHVSWSWDEFTELCRKATEAGKEKGIYAIGLFAGNQSSDSNTMGWLMGSGTSLLNDSMNEVKLNANGGVKALEFLSNLVKQGYAMPGASTLTDDDIIESFFSGNILISQYADLWMVNEAYNREQNNELNCSMDAQYYLFPTIDGKPKMYTGYPSEGFSIFDNGDETKIEAAKLFIDFVLNSKWEKEYVERAGQLPTRDGYELYTSKDKVAREVQRMTDFSKYYQSEWGSSLSCWPEIRSYFYPEIQAVYSNQKESKEALDNFASNANKILKDIQ